MVVDGSSFLVYTYVQWRSTSFELWKSYMVSVKRFRNPRHGFWRWLFVSVELFLGFGLVSAPVVIILCECFGFAMWFAGFAFGGLGFGVWILPFLGFGLRVVFSFLLLAGLFQWFVWMNSFSFCLFAGDWAQGEERKGRESFELLCCFVLGNMKNWSFMMKKYDDFII